jgi:two-component system sensor histidine kinase KdpD
VTSDEPLRPDPDALLAEARKGGRGRLKLFLGAAPGVGKTYAMLEEAQARRAEGVDVAVALVETHGRTETAELLDGLPQLPRVALSHRGQTIDEMDLDALIARRPQLAVIDEFAHTNAPNARHPKRWQDVMEVLDAGIDVVTTLNIQHIESLNDVVAQITGVRVQETVPDEVLARADEVELIDLPPEALIERLKAGKVYVPQQIGRALENFFSRGNLTALRELALRTTASRVDADMVSFMRSNAVKGPWPTEERLLVCVAGPNARTLVRTARRMAGRAKIPWIAVTLVRPGEEASDAETRPAVFEALRLAEALGGEVEALHVERDAAEELIAFARKRNVTRIVIGRRRSGVLARVLRRGLTDRLLERATDFEVTVLPTPPAPGTRRPALRRRLADLRPSLRIAGETLAAMTAATAVAWPFWHVVPVASIAVVYLVAVLAIGMRHGLVGALSASAVGFLTYNFFFTEPYYSFAVAQHESIVALLVFLVSALATGTLAGQLQARLGAMRAAKRQTDTLYAFARRIASATRPDDVLWAAVSHIATTLNCRALILMPDQQGVLQQVQGHPAIEEELDPRVESAARWAFDRNEAAGLGTGTLPTSDWLFVPFGTVNAVLGVIGIQFIEPGRALDPETKRLLAAVEDQVAVAVERLKLAAELEGARVSAESERLRAALLNSVSHDLRTPLVTVIGALAALAEGDGGIPEDNRRDLAQAGLEEARRLDRYVQNLLDMTKLGHGSLKPRRAAIDLRELIGHARADLARVLSGHRLDVDMPRDLPRADIDPVLIGQAIANVLENAAKYAPSGTTIRVGAHAEPHEVVLTITDEGPGIPEADRERVFDLFYRVRRGDGQPAGTGLGLAIVRGLIEAHGGTARALPGAAGTGTTIELRLPAAAIEALPAEFTGSGEGE